MFHQDNDHHDDDKQEGDVEEAHVEEDITKDYHVCACHKQQLKFLSLVGAILVLAVVVASICLSGHCSSSSSNAASSRDSGATAPTSVQNVTAPMAPSSAMLPTNAPILSPTAPTATTPSPVTPGGASPLFTSPPTRAPTQLPTLAQSPTMQSIQDAGVLPCGYYDVTLSEDGESGFSIELCKALAAAIFRTTNVTNRYTAIPVTTLDRFTTLQNGGVDVLVGFTTHTMERQVRENTTGEPFAFSTPYLYSSLTFGGDKQYIDCIVHFWNNDTTFLENAICDDVRICVRKGSYIAQKVSELLDVPFTVTTALTVETFYGRYGSGDCTVLAADQFQVSKNVTQRYLPDATLDNYTTTVDSIFIKSEPVSMITRKDDILWSDFVNWVVYGLIYSELKGYTKADTLANPDASYYAEWDGFGEENKDMFLFTNQVVSHSGEIYGNNLEKYVPRQTINTINDGTMGGVIYSVSFGNLTGSLGTEPDTSSTLQVIQRRNRLNCGVFVSAIFTERTSNSDGSYTYSGFDVDYCRAIAAALFYGNPNAVNFIPLTASERFEALQNGTVDVLSRITSITPDSDILRTFSPPTFFDTVLLGGLSQYVEECLEPYKQEGICANMKICVTSNTTTLDVVKKNYQEALLEVDESSGGDIVQYFAESRCQVLAGGLSRVALAQNSVGSAVNFTVIAPFDVIDPLAVVTRQDDPTFSDFVSLVVTATFYAEENGITMANANTAMPEVSLFGSRYTQMLRHAISAVGSYRTIYDRNIQDHFARSGLNRLYSANFSTPLLYAPYDLGKL